MLKTIHRKMKWNVIFSMMAVAGISSLVTGIFASSAFGVILAP